MANKFKKNELDNGINESDFKKIPILFHTLSIHSTIMDVSIDKNKELSLRLKPSFYKYV
jgi:hypothetical protein